MPLDSTAAIGLAGVVKNLVGKVSTETISRAWRASNELRNAELNVLRGQRSGRVYRKPFSKGTYRSSAPGEPPAVRTGTLRRSWRPTAASEKKGKGVVVMPGIKTDVPYAPGLQKGTSRMAPRPYEDAVVEQAKPKIKQIFGAPYLGK